MRRGQVFWADFSPRSGSEQRGWRPAVVVSNDGFNLSPGWRSLIVVPFSRSGAQARRGPTAVPLSRGAGGLGKPGVVLCHQVTTLDRTKLGKHIGTLSADTLAMIDRGLRTALDLD